MREERPGWAQRPRPFLFRLHPGGVVHIVGSVKVDGASLVEGSGLPPAVAATKPVSLCGRWGRSVGEDPIEQPMEFWLEELCGRCSVAAGRWLPLVTALSQDFLS